MTIYNTDANINDIVIPSSSKNTRRILLVDDRDDIQHSIKKALNKLDLDIICSKDSDHALTTLRNENFAVVLAGDGGDNLDGLAFLEKARHAAPNSLRIFISSKTELRTAVQAINKTGLFSFITMPWNVDTFRDNVRRACDHYFLKRKNNKLVMLLGEKADALKSLAGHLENAVENRTTSLLLGLNAALDLRDNETQVHSRRVALYAKRMAEDLLMPDEQILIIERGSLLHDIGKIGVSDTILLKPGKLTDDEWVEMRKHAEHGYRILENIDFLGDARLIVWQHHERWDGNGYPNKLKAKDITIGARIFSIIDTYDAITSDRPYRSAQSYEAAATEIKKMAGSQFDPAIVDLFLKIPKTDLDELSSVAQKITPKWDNPSKITH